MSIAFFKYSGALHYVVESVCPLASCDIQKLKWLFSGAEIEDVPYLKGLFAGPRKEMVSPWSTNAVEVTRNMGIEGIVRIEKLEKIMRGDGNIDPMIQQLYRNPDSSIFELDKTPEEILSISDIKEYNDREGLALSAQEIEYLEKLSSRLGRPLTDSEVFGFSQVNSEHCRHKIFNGTFIIDGEEQPVSLFKMIKKTSEENPNGLVSAYKDNVAFFQGPKAMQFAPDAPETASLFSEREINTVISLKAETHNFPTTVEPFNGAATGTGGEIRDRMAGGKASLPIAGTAVYMTSYPRLGDDRIHERYAPLPRPWLYQTPAQILIKASNGASDFGNKFGQPLVCGSVLTFEHKEESRTLAYDKVIMLAGGVGYGTLKDALKDTPEPGMDVVVMGGDNYRIGMGGGAVSSVQTGEYDNSIELNAVQRANPEMQKRVSNVVRALAEMEDNPCVSIHDHGAGGHLNSLSELVEETGGKIYVDKLPVGDATLSDKEIIGNESQERMGLVIPEKDVERVRKIAERERSPFYVVGKTTDDSRFVFENKEGKRPIDLAMSDMFGSSPKTVIKDNHVPHNYSPVAYDISRFESYLRGVLGLEAVACKDWLTNKVDRSVTGRVARQQCVGPLQLPLSDCGVVALDYRGKDGIATSIGHAPQAALISPAAGSVLSIAESLTNIVGANLKEGLKSVSLSANWMWPCKNDGEDAALYDAVKACSEFAIALGINIPTGKDSLSMTQKYKNESVYAPGTVIISAAGHVEDIRKTVSPVLSEEDGELLYIGMSRDDFKLGGSAFAQSLNKIGDVAPTVKDPAYFATVFNTIQKAVGDNLILAMHDISAGGLITTLLEMTFSNTQGGLDIKLDGFNEPDVIKILFAENPALVLQVSKKSSETLKYLLTSAGVDHVRLGSLVNKRNLLLSKGEWSVALGIEDMRNVWYTPSWKLDCLQTNLKNAMLRFRNYSKQPVRFGLPLNFDCNLAACGTSFDRPARTGIKAAIIREKGINGDREMAYSLHLAGFDVKDVHMTDLISGRENLEDVNFIVFCGGFSNSDVLGSAKGWAGAFLYNPKAADSLDRFYRREDTLSLGVCNGCQLMMELGLLDYEHKEDAALPMLHNTSGKFESAFVSVIIENSNSVMMKSLTGTQLGIWVAHGEGRFAPAAIDKFVSPIKYAYSSYPGNPNGTRRSVAALCSEDGRHLAMMPHLERAIFPWQCAHYIPQRRNDEVTPWFSAFVNARKWVEKHRK